MLNGSSGDLRVWQSGGTDAYVSPAELSANGLSGDAARVQCGVSLADSERVLTAAEIAAGRISSAHFSAIGGAAWVQDTVAGLESATEVTIPGVDRAFLVDDERVVLAVFDGPNYLTVSVPDGIDESIYPTIALVLQAFDNGPIG